MSRAQPAGPSRRTSVRRPVTAAAAAMAGLMRWVRAPGPWRPSKFRLEVDATRSPGRAASPFIATHIEHPGSRHSNARVPEDPVEALGLRVPTHLPRAGHDHRGHDRPAPAEDGGGRAEILEPAVRARPDEDAVDGDRLEGRPRDEPHVRERAIEAGSADRVARRRRVRYASRDGARILRARAPRHRRDDGRHVERDLPVEARGGVGGQGLPGGERPPPRIAARRERPAFEVRVGRLVRRDHPRARARLDRHVAEGHPRLHRERADRRARVLQDVPRAAPRADGRDQVEGQVLGGDAEPEPAVDRDPHDLRATLPDRLGRQDVLDLGRADAERQRPEGAVGRRVRVAADDREARQRQPLLRTDDVDDALPRIAGSEERDAPRRGVLAELVDLAPDLRVGDPSGWRAGRHVVISHGDREIGAPDLATRPAKHLERVERALVDEMTVDVEETPAPRRPW